MAAALSGWLAAGWGWPWLAGAGPSWRLVAIARCDPVWGLAGLGWRTPTHTAHTHKTHNVRLRRRRRLVVIVTVVDKYVAIVVRRRWCQRGRC